MAISEQGLANGDTGTPWTIHSCTNSASPALTHVDHIQEREYDTPGTLIWHTCMIHLVIPS